MLGHVGGRAANQCDDLVDRFARQRSDLHTGSLGIRQEFPILGERREGRAQGRESIRRNARRRDHRSRDGLLREEQLQHLAVGVAA